MVIITRQQTDQGQVWLPFDLRQEMGLEEGDAVDFVRNEFGQIVLRKSIHQEQFFGLLDKYNSKESVSLKEIDPTILEEACGQFDKALPKKKSF